MDKNLEGDRGGKSEARNRVGWDLAADSAGGRFHISVADTDFLPVQIVWILEGEMVREDACEPDLDDSTATIEVGIDPWIIIHMYEL